MIQILLVAVPVAAVAVVAALALRARRRGPVEAAANATVPTHVDRRDFPEPDKPWLVAVFTSATCDTCAGVWQKVEPLASSEVAIAQVEAKEQRNTHARYRIDAVPLLIVADRLGTVRAHVLGAVSAQDLWGVMASLRDPASGRDER